MYPATFRFTSSKSLIDPTRLKAVAIDLDGTMLHADASLSERSAGALRVCLDRGVAVVFCTGRSPAAAEKFRAAVGARGPMVFYNGAAVIEAPSGALLSFVLLPADICLGALDIARRLDLHFHVFLPDGRLAYEKYRPEVEIYAKRTGLRGEIRDLEAEFASGQGARRPNDGGQNAGAQSASGQDVGGSSACAQSAGIHNAGGQNDSAPSGAIKAMFIGDSEKLAAAEAAIDERFHGKVYRARSHATFLELMALGVSKGTALRQALAARGIAPEATIGFGDAENDLPMLDAAGYAVVPANASPAVQAHADLVVPSADDDGPAQFIEAYFL